MKTTSGQLCSPIASLRGSFLAALLALSFTSAAADDPYLQGLKAESDKLEQMGRARKEQESLERRAEAPAQPAITSQSVSAPAAAPSGAVAEFEKGLKQFPAGFALYEKLDDERRQVVFVEYSKEASNNRRYSAAIRKTIELTVRSGH